jgi:hypothetical protein
VSFSFTLTSSSTLCVESDTQPQNLSADDVEKLIAELAKFRQKMKPEVPHELGPPLHVPGIEDPSLAVRSHRGSNAKTIAIRHPGIGWLQFLLSEEEVKKLGDHLL